MPMILPASAITQLEELRRKIDRLDTRLVQVLAERRECVRRICALKQRAGLPLRDSSRETAIRKRCLRLAELLGLETALLDQVLETLFMQVESPPQE